MNDLNQHQLLKCECELIGWVSSETCLSGFKFLTCYGCSYFFGFISGFNDAMLLVVGDIPVDSEALVVIS